MKYDFIVVGAGLFGACFAYQAKQAGKKVLVLEKRGHVGGNVYTENRNGLHVHRYGAHIFHTNSTKVWKFVNQFSEFNRFTNSPIANYKGELYSLPFNMYTFNQMWGVKTPEEAKAKIREEKLRAGIEEPANLEEQAISLVGKDIYEKLIKGYTQKQWGRICTELPSFIIKRIPVRFTFDNNYFNAIYQGIPIGGYTQMVEKMLEGIEVRLNTDFLSDKEYFMSLGNKVIYTGPIDGFFDYSLGTLDYRSLRFDISEFNTENYQGVAVMNYTDAETPYTRSIEHKWFQLGEGISEKNNSKTVVSFEYSMEWKPGVEPYYPLNNEKNNMLYQKYVKLSENEDRVLFGGRLAEYKYYDMDQVILRALELSESEFSKEA